ncbi:unnamed protein product, partial [Prorocentrum cordatum]
PSGSPSSLPPRARRRRRWPRSARRRARPPAGTPRTAARRPQWPRAGTAGSPSPWLRRSARPRRAGGGGGGQRKRGG